MNVSRAKRLMLILILVFPMFSCSLVFKGKANESFPSLPCIKAFQKSVEKKALKVSLYLQQGHQYIDVKNCEKLYLLDFRSHNEPDKAAIIFYLIEYSDLIYSAKSPCISSVKSMMVSSGYYSNIYKYLSDKSECHVEGDNLDIIWSYWDDDKDNFVDLTIMSKYRFEFSESLSNPIDPRPFLFGFDFNGRRGTKMFCVYGKEQSRRSIESIVGDCLDTIN